MNESRLLKFKIYHVRKKEKNRSWVPDLFLASSSQGPFFFGSCTTRHSHPSCSLLLAQQLISRRLHPKSARTLLTPLVYFKVAASASYWAPLSPSRHANTERFVFCSVAPCLIPFPESLSYFSNSGLVRSCQHPFPWEPVNKQRRAFVHPLSCFYHLFLRRTLGIPSSMTHHGVDCPPRQSGSSRGETHPDDH